MLKLTLFDSSVGVSLTILKAQKTYLLSLECRAFFPYFSTEFDGLTHRIFCPRIGFCTLPVMFSVYLQYVLSKKMLVLKQSVKNTNSKNSGLN